MSAAKLTGLPSLAIPRLDTLALSAESADNGCSAPHTSFLRWMAAGDQFTKYRGLDPKNGLFVPQHPQAAVAAAVVSAGGARSGGGGWGGFLSALLGGGSIGVTPGAASGGWRPGGSMFEVNERGFEMASVGGRDYMLTGSQPVEITPHNALTGPGMTQNFNFALAAPTDPRTQAQIAQRAAFETRRAQSRNS